MKIHGNNMLYRYAVLGFLTGGISTIPWFLILTGYFTHQRLTSILLSNYTGFIVATIPFIVSLMGYGFARFKLSKLRLNDRLQDAESESNHLKNELLEYQYALDLSAIVTVIDNTGKIAKVNNNLLAFTGFRRNDLIGRSIWRLPSSLQRPGVFQEIADKIQSREVWSGEIEFYKTDGNTAYTRAIVVPLQQTSSKNNDCLVIQYDITEQKNKDLALRRSEKEKSIILSNTRSLICTHDFDGVITNINRAGAEMLGDSQEAIKGQRLQNFMDPRYSIEDYMRAIKTEGVSSGYLKVITKQKEKKTLLYNNVACIDQEPGYVIGSALDITETLEAHRTIDNQRSFINMIVDESPNMICVIDESNNIPFLNKKLKSVFDLGDDNKLWSLQEAVEQIPGFASFLGWDKNTIPNEKYSIHECKITHPQKHETSWFKVHKTTFEDNSKQKFAMFIATDISTKIATEQELIKARQEIETSLRLKENFIANMSHEIRTPLNAIIGFSELLFDTNLTNQQVDYLKTIKVASQNLLGIINDILDLSRLEAGMIEIARNQSDISKIVTNVKKLFEPKVIAKNIELNVTMGAGISKRVLCDETRINQILMNLVGNAVKFTNNGQVDIIVKPLTSKNEPIQQLEFVVKDTGIGIEKDKLDVIFNRYSQASGDIHKLYGGTGLGLSISKSLIELLGGEIKLSSEKGVGTIFSFVIPFETVQEEQTVVAPTAITEQGHGQQQLKILLAEDNRTNARLAMHILGKLNHQVVHVTDGTEVLEQLKQRHFDVILMDVQMATMDGLETTRHIRQSNEAYNNIPIIALTAHSFKGEKDTCSEAGMNGYVSKPYRPDELIAGLEKTMALHQINNDKTLIYN